MSFISKLESSEIQRAYTVREQVRGIYFDSSSVNLSFSAGSSDDAPTSGFWTILPQKRLVVHLPALLSPARTEKRASFLRTSLYYPLHCFAMMFKAAAVLLLAASTDAFVPQGLQRYVSVIDRIVLFY